MPDDPDYDSPWKDILERFSLNLQAFSSPLFIRALTGIGNSTFLDKEFQQLVRDSEMGRRLADKLVRVHTLDGSPLMLLIHVEVQGSHETNFAERMYVYNYRIYDKYRCPVVSLAVLTDDSRTWRPDSFTFGCWGFSLEMVFPIVKLLDYNNMAELENNSNPFAVVVMAHLKARETRHNTDERYEWKWHLTLELYERGYDKQDVIHLFLFIDWVMTLRMS